MYSRGLVAAVACVYATLRASKNHARRQLSDSRATFYDGYSLPRLFTGVKSQQHARRWAVVGTTALFVFWLWYSTPESGFFLIDASAKHEPSRFLRSLSNASEPVSSHLLHTDFAAGANAQPEQRQQVYPSSQQISWESQARSENMDIRGPTYKIRVLRSTLQHSKHMYQDLKNEAHGPLFQTLLHLHVIDGMRPERTDESVTASCNFLRSLGSADTWRQPARIHTYAPLPTDNNVGHSFAISVECENPLQLQSVAENIHAFTIDVSFDAGQLKTETFEGQNKMVFVTATKNNIPVKVTPPLQSHSEFAVCIPPLDFRLNEERLWRLVEWRQHMLNIGIERVNWYLRDDTFRGVLEEFRAMQGTKDVLRHAPHLIPTLSGQHLDQNVWYWECMQNNVYSSDWIIIADIDEFILPNFEEKLPFQQLSRFMRAREEHIGEVVMDRIEMIKLSKQTKQKNGVELLQNEFRCAHSGRGMFKSVADGRHHVKTIYRSHAVARFGQHRHIDMFPLPEAISSQHGMSQGTLWQPVNQPSYEHGAWPKLAHYRSWGEGMDQCDLPSPMAGQPRYQLYLQVLHQNVSAMADYLVDTFDID